MTDWLSEIKARLEARQFRSCCQYTYEDIANLLRAIEVRDEKMGRILGEICGENIFTTQSSRPHSPEEIKFIVRIQKEIEEALAWTPMKPSEDEK